MNPTPKLRFVERSVVIGHDGSAAIAKTIRVLQQWFESDWATEGMWKDVPLETEE